MKRFILSAALFGVVSLAGPARPAPGADAGADPRADPAEKAAPAPKDAPPFSVRVVYLYPADQERFPEYEEAIPVCVEEVKAWYKEKAGVSFRTLPMEVIQAKEDYLTMKCGDNPKDRARAEKDRKHMPHWIKSVEKAAGMPERTVTWVFAQGGGAVAVGDLEGDFQGIAMFGDWVLEPISGKENPEGVPASMDEEQFYVKGGTPVGTTVHELGHGLGLLHPDGYPEKARSIMAEHWGYPKNGFHPHEVLALKHCPFTAEKCFDDKAPFVSYRSPRRAVWGEPYALSGEGFRAGDEVEFVDEKGGHRVKPETLEDKSIVVRPPRDVGPGVVRVRRGELRSNAIPVNVYEIPSVEDELADLKAELLKLDKALGKIAEIRQGILDSGPKVRSQVEEFQKEVVKSERFESRYTRRCVENLVRALAVEEAARSEKTDRGLARIERRALDAGILSMAAGLREIPAEEFSPALEGIRLFDAGEATARKARLLAYAEGKDKVFPVASLLDLEPFLKKPAGESEAVAAAVALLNLLACREGPEHSPWRAESLRAESGSGGIRIEAKQKIAYKDAWGAHEAEDLFELELDAGGKCAGIKPVRRHAHGEGK